MTILRRTVLTICAIPIGACGGFVCGAIIVSACTFFGVRYERCPGTPLDWHLYGSYILTAALMPGACVGGIALPLVYIISFRDLSLYHLVRAGFWIGVSVVAGGLIASPAQELVALIGTLIGFVVGWNIAFTKTHKAQPPTQVVP